VKYVRIYCFVGVLSTICGPACAGNGNALAGGWNGEVPARSLGIGGTGGSQFGVSAVGRVAPQASASAHASSSGSVDGSSGLSIFDLGFTSGGARNLGAPGPEAGAGLTSLALAGAYALMRRRRTVGKAASRR
jgi:hypothetical protein